MGENQLSQTDQLINQLMDLHPKGYDLSLDRILQLLQRLGNPQDKLPPVIHVAGTNGKGSFTAFSRALLEAEDYVVHVHTSPHLVRWHERFRLGQKGGGQFASDAVLADAIARVAKANDGQKITVFEILTAAMFLLFSEHPADAVIIEVGLGGRFDATNVIKESVASVIMPVSLDHMGLLGDSADKIAFEKAGILKKSGRCIIGKQPFSSAQDVLVDQAEKLSNQAHIFGQDFMGYEEHGRFVYQDDDGLMDLPKPNLLGHHQISNAATAIKAVKSAGFKINTTAIEKAMKTVSWPGRFQPLPKGDLQELYKAHALPDIYMDGGHNPDAARALVNIINELNTKDPRPLVMIAGMLNTKEPDVFFSPFKPVVAKVLTVPITSSEAGIPATELQTIIENDGMTAKACSDLKDALITAAEPIDGLTPRILICGSLYVVGDVLSQNGTIPE